MNLRRQLLLVSLLLLSLPWAGCQFIREMEGALRQGQEQSLQATAHAIAAVLGENPRLIYPNDERRGGVRDERNSIYAVPHPLPLIVDGYGDGWEEITSVNFHSSRSDSGLSVSYQAVTREDKLYLLLKVQDPDVIYHNPGISREPNGDRVLLRTWQHGRRQEYVIATAAPGNVRARAASRRERGVDASRIRGYWQDATGGYSLELEIPLSYTGDRLGFYVLDAASRDGTTVETLGNVTSLETAAPPWLIYTPHRLQQTLTAFKQQGKHVQVIDQHHWLVADIPPETGRGGTSADTFWLLRKLYRSILSEEELSAIPVSTTAGQTRGEEIDLALAGNTSIQRYSDPDSSTRTYLSIAVPISHRDRVIGAVTVRQAAEQYLSLTDQAFSRLLGYSLSALVIGALGLLGYATLLSWRIGKLNSAAREVVAEDGTIRGEFPRSHARDEIGELSRAYADLLDKLRVHNDYLRTLSRKLSHELRTPIALIQTSMEHLERGDLPAEDQRAYIQRSRQGLDRLGKILTAMSEASRLEESLRHNPLEHTDLVPLLRQVTEAYQSLYREHRLKFSSDLKDAWCRAAGDLLAQAMDKLVDNAVTFTPAGGTIEISLRQRAGMFEIAVSNEGPPLPDTLPSRLFEPMVSLRSDSQHDIHLGLGLHVVRLIADYHGGEVSADNLPNRQGAQFSLFLPGLKPVLDTPS